MSWAFFNSYVVPFLRLAVWSLILGALFIIRRFRHRRRAKYSLAFLLAPLLFAALPALLGISVDGLYSVLHFGEPVEVSLGEFGFVAGFVVGILFQLWVMFSGGGAEQGAAADRGNR